MKVHRLCTKQFLPISMEKAWTYFFDPGNLPELTPLWMHFSVDLQPEGAVYSGMIATYHLRPLLGIRLSWVTEITHVKEHAYFVDEQRFGPYRFWHHEHHFKSVKGGVEVTDIVHYSMPFGILGSIVHTLSVKKKLQEVFDFRYKELERLFGVTN